MLDPIKLLKRLIWSCYYSTCSLAIPILASTFYLDKVFLTANNLIVKGFLKKKSHCERDIECNINLSLLVDQIKLNSVLDNQTPCYEAYCKFVISINLTWSYDQHTFYSRYLSLCLIRWFCFPPNAELWNCLVLHSYDFRILDIATENLQQSFENDFPDNCKEQNTYSRELLEYCCHKALHEVTTRPDYLADKNLRRLMFDMMLAWESPGVQDEILVNVRAHQCCSCLLKYFSISDFVKCFFFGEISVVVSTFLPR